jgi:hypothetical protein
MIMVLHHAEFELVLLSHWWCTRDNQTIEHDAYIVRIEKELKDRWPILPYL